jgi:hypothetical protein
MSRTFDLSLLTSGKTTRETYDAMVSEITKRIDRAEETVETILITLREDAR